MLCRMREPGTSRPRGGGLGPGSRICQAGAKMTVIYSTLESGLPLKFSSLRWMRAVVFRWRGWSHRLWSHSDAGPARTLLRYS